MAVTKRIKTIFQFRRATTEEWELNKDVIPAAGEPCYNLTSGTLKIGDGKTSYENLKVIGGATISDDGLSLIVEDLQADVSELQTLVGNSSVEDQIAEAMVGVAKDSDLQKVVNNITVLETQVNTSNDSVTEMQTLVEQNNAIVTELQTVVENKADVETVKELQTIVETKVDEEAMNEMSTELKTYVNEQIKLVEVGNIDDGEI